MIKNNFCATIWKVWKYALGSFQDETTKKYDNYKLEYIADIEYNSMILYPSHNWHNSYIKQDWFNDEDRITFTGFFEIV